MENYAEMCAKCTHKYFCYKWADAHKEKAGHCRGEYFEEDILAGYDKEWVKILLKADREARLIVVAEEFGDEKAKEITETVRKALEKKWYNRFAAYGRKVSLKISPLRAPFHPPRPFPIRLFESALSERRHTSGSTN